MARLIRDGLGLDDARAGARLLRGLPRFLRNPLTLEDARARVRRRLERREGDFLAMTREAIYEHSPSPYRALLRLAGCEWGDLERMVRQEGLEGTLRTLLRHGVYLTVDELKGRRPVIRGSATLAVPPGGTGNPLVAPDFMAQTGGSRGPRALVAFNLPFVRDAAVDIAVAAAAGGVRDADYAVWLTPGGDAISKLLRYAAAGMRPARWFAQIDPGARDLHPSYRWSARLLVAAGLLARRSLPRPQVATLDNPLPVARWMAEVLGQGRAPHVNTYASAAVRLCEAARGAGIDLGGASFTIGSEPITAARLAVIHRAGGRAFPLFATMDSGPIALGCLAPQEPDDHHLLEDMLAAIQPGDARSGLPPRALLVTSLRRNAPQILLNVSLGDQAVLERRPCGCGLGSLGWSAHLHTIRSFEKLTAGGMTFLDTDLVRILEEALPARFGGGPTDYQLVEAERADGHSSLRLLVHPRLGPLESDAVGRAFLDAVGMGGGAERVMALAWREGHVLTVERRAPMTTAAGKILHLHARSRRA